MCYTCMRGYSYLFVITFGGSIDVIYVCNGCGAQIHYTRCDITRSLGANTSLGGSITVAFIISGWIFNICGVEWEYFDESMRFEILADITKKRALIRTPFFHLFVLCKLLPFFWSWSCSFLMHRTRVIASQRQRNKKYNKSSFLLACIGFERERKKTENCKLIFGTKMA